MYRVPRLATNPEGDNMTIYVTPFKNSTKRCSGPSTDSGFASLDDVVTAMGEPDVKRSKKMLIYGPGEDRVVFSGFIFCIDGDGSTG